MNFDFSPEQLELREQARNFFRRACPLERVREVADGNEAGLAALWKEACQYGIAGLVVPQDHGGLGFSPLELCVVTEEAGRALVPAPVAGPPGVMALGLTRYADEATRTRWLPRLASGDSVPALAFAPVHSGRFHGEPGIALRDRFVSGVIDVVPDGAVADVLLVAWSETEGADAILGWVDVSSAGAERALRVSTDPTRKVARFLLEGSEMHGLMIGPQAREACVWLRNAAAVVIAFEQLGLAERALQQAVDYALVRTTFGRLIGSYQAIKHKLADVLVSIQLARAHAYMGAWALASDSPRLALAAAAARVACTEASVLAAQENLQVHGGFGYTWASDCHLFYRRARYYGAMLGSVAAWRHRLANAIRGSAVSGARTRQRLV